MNPLVATHTALHSPQRTPSPKTGDQLWTYSSPTSDYFTDPNRNHSSPASALSHGFPLSPTHGVFSGPPTPSQWQAVNRLELIRDRVLSRQSSDAAYDTFHQKLDGLEEEFDKPDVLSKPPESCLFKWEEESDVSLVENDQAGADLFALQLENISKHRDQPSNSDSDSPHVILACEEDDVFAPQHCDGTSEADSVAAREMGYEELQSEASTSEVHSSISDVAEDEAVTRVMNVATQLRQRLTEVKTNNHQIIGMLDSRNDQLLALRSENDTLSASLSFAQSELLYLRLKFCDLEAQVAPFLSDHSSTEARQTLRSGMDRWGKDWEAVDARFKTKCTTAEIGKTAVNNVLSQQMDKSLGAAILSEKQDKGPVERETGPSLIGPDCVSTITPTSTSEIQQIHMDAFQETSSQDDQARAADEEDSADPTALPPDSTTCTVSSHTLKPVLLSEQSLPSLSASPPDLTSRDRDPTNSKQRESPKNSRISTNITTTTTPITTAHKKTSLLSPARQPAPKQKTPWQELWSSLTSFAGMDNIFEDEN